MQDATRPDGDEDRLPDNLVRLLEMDADDVLTDEVAQRAYNLVWSKPTAYNVSCSEPWVDAIVNDPAIRSPLDAIAAWRSALAIHDVLLNSLSADMDDLVADKAIEKDLEIVRGISPPGSHTWARGLVVTALLSNEMQGKQISVALQGLRTSHMPGAIAKVPAEPNADSQSGSLRGAILPDDIALGLWSALAIAVLNRTDREKAAQSLGKQVDRCHIGIGLLGLAALDRFLRAASRDKTWLENHRGLSEKTAKLLRLSTGREEMGLSREAKARAVSLSVGVFRRLVRIGDAEEIDQDEG